MLLILNKKLLFSTLAALSLLYICFYRPFLPPAAVIPLDPKTCVPLPGLSDVLIIVKTGACELHTKLPIHLSTTLRCVPASNFTVYSDLAETFQGIPVYDALAGDVSQPIVDSVDEFKLYKKLAEIGSCEGLGPEDLNAPADHPGNNGNSKSRNWNLDKWKFLPVVHKAYRQRPEAKWYLIVEVDTYIVWENLVSWLGHFDPKEEHYFGSQMAIGDQLFAYGGAGTIISNPAMRKVAEHFEANRTQLEEYIGPHWAGDCVLGKALQDVGVKMLWAWPYLNTDTVSSANFSKVDYGMRMWCAPVVSYHHMNGEEIGEFWEWQKRWSMEHPSQLLRQRDVFVDYIQPKLEDEREMWDNFCETKFEEGRDIESLDQCRSACYFKDECLQYSYSTAKGCQYSKAAKFGRAKEGSDEKITSGWMKGRIREQLEKTAPCTQKEERWRNDYYGEGLGFK